MVRGTDIKTRFKFMIEKQILQNKIQVWIGKQIQDSGLD